MNPTTLNLAFKTASNLWSQFNNYREEKSREAYTALEEAAQKMDERDNGSFAESRRQAGFKLFARAGKAVHHRTRQRW